MKSLATALFVLLAVASLLQCAMADDSSNNEERRCLKWAKQFKCVQREKAPCGTRSYGCIKRPCLKAVNREVCVRRRGECKERRQVKFCAKRSTSFVTRCSPTGETHKVCVRHHPDSLNCLRYRDVEKRGCCSEVQVCAESDAQGNCVRQKQETQCTCTVTEKVCAQYEHKPQCLEYKDVPKQKCVKSRPCERFDTAFRCVNRGPLRCTQFKTTAKCVRRGPCIEFGQRCSRKGRCLKRKPQRVCAKWNVAVPDSQEANLEQAGKVADFYKTQCVEAVAKCEVDDEKCKTAATGSVSCRQYVTQYKHYLALLSSVQEARAQAAKHSRQEQAVKRRDQQRRRFMHLVQVFKQRERKWSKRCFTHYRTCVEHERDHCKKLARKFRTCKMARFWRRRRACIETRYDCRFGSKSTRAWHCNRWQWRCSKKAQQHLAEARRQREEARKKALAKRKARQEKAWNLVVQTRQYADLWQNRCQGSNATASAANTAASSSSSSSSTISAGAAAELQQNCRLANTWAGRLRCVRLAYHCKFVQKSKKGKKVCWRRYRQQCPKGGKRGGSMADDVAKRLLSRQDEKDSLRARAHRLQRAAVLLRDECTQSLRDCDDDHCRKFVTQSDACHEFHRTFHSLRCTIHMYRCEFGSNDTVRQQYCQRHEQQCTLAGRQHAQEEATKVAVQAAHQARYDAALSESRKWQPQCAALIDRCANNDTDCRTAAANTTECITFRQFRVEAKCWHADVKCRSASTALVREFYCNKLQKKCDGFLKEQQEKDGELKKQQQQLQQAAAGPDAPTTVGTDYSEADIEAILGARKLDLDAANSA